MMLQRLSENVAFTYCRCHFSSVSLRWSEILVLTNKGSDEEEGNGEKKAFPTLELLRPCAGTSVVDSEASLGVQHHSIFLQSSHACVFPSSYTSSSVWTWKCQGAGETPINFVGYQWPEQRGEESLLPPHCSSLSMCHHC